MGKRGKLGSYLDSALSKLWYYLTIDTGKDYVRVADIVNKVLYVFMDAEQLS